MMKDGQYIVVNEDSMYVCIAWNWRTFDKKEDRTMETVFWDSAEWRICLITGGCSDDTWTMIECDFWRG